MRRVSFSSGVPSLLNIGNVSCNLHFPLQDALFSLLCWSILSDLEKHHHFPKLLITKKETFDYIDLFKMLQTPTANLELLERYIHVRVT